MLAYTSAMLTNFTHALQQQAAAAAAARAAEEQKVAARPQRKPAPRPVRSRPASPSSDSEEFEYDSPYARYRGVLSCHQK